MPVIPDQPRPRRLWRVVAGVVFYCLFAPPALFALPFFGLVIAGRPRARGDIVLAAAAGAFGVWWLAQPGDLADQVLRAAAVIGTAAFVLTAMATKWSVTHRALVAIAAAAAATSGLLVAVRRTWWELGWTVAHRTGFLARQSFGIMYGAVARGSDGQPSPSSMQWLKGLSQWLDTTVQLMSAYYPATIALQLLAGFALATALCQHIATAAPGTTLGRLREFRFSEHLGWGLAIPLLVLLIPQLAVGRIAAGNLLIVTIALYALRGMAVATFGLMATGGGSLFLSTAIALAIVFMLPVVLAGTVLLGVLDAGLDLRRRWTTPPAGE